MAVERDRIPYFLAFGFTQKHALIARILHTARTLPT
jgi:hypothetical protein